MNERVFKEILEESFKREYAEFDNVLEHKFSLKHRIAMKRVFARYDKNVRGFEGYDPVQIEPHYSLKQRLIVALVVIILMTLLTGWFIPIRGIMEEQIDWLRSRYDFPTMKTRVSQDYEAGQTSSVIVLGVYRITDEYMNFLADLEHLGMYSAEELQEIRRQTIPTYTRPKNATLPSKMDSYLEAVPFHGETLVLDEYREHVKYLEKKIAYFIERANDPERAVEGDAEYAEMIREKYLYLHKGFLELLEKLNAEVPGNENDLEKQKIVSSNFDKDDKIKLLKINKVQKT